MGKKKFTIKLNDIKSSDGWGELIFELGLTDEKIDQFFEFGEYASLSIEVDEDMNILGGKILEVKSQNANKSNKAYQND